MVLNLLRKSVIRSVAGENAPVVAVDSLKDRTVMLYFSASWCPPCRAFTPALISFYNKHHTSKNFEVVFCSWDSNEEEFNAYYKTHPWLAMTRRDVDELSSQLQVRTIPSLIVIKGDTGDIITREGRMAVVKDPTAERFPWEGISFEEKSTLHQIRSAKVGLAMMVVAAAALYYYYFFLEQEVDEVPIDTE